MRPSEDPRWYRCNTCGAGRGEPCRVAAENVKTHREIRRRPHLRRRYMALEASLRRQART